MAMWLGVREEPGEILVGTHNGVVKARTFGEDRMPRSASA